MRKLLSVIVPVISMAIFPILMLVSPSEQTILRLWGAAMLVLSFIAGREVSGALSLKGAFAWLLGDIALLMVLAFSGVLGHSPTLAHKMGMVATYIVGLALPVAAMQAKMFERRWKARRQNEKPIPRSVDE